MSSNRTYSRLPLFLGLGALLAGCGGQAANLVRPDAPTVGEALDLKAPTCEGAPKQMEPLIVDVSPDTRTKLEAAMQDGVVVVKYDCQNLEVLPACSLPNSSYGYRGTSLREQVKQIKEMDDLAVNFPVSAAKLGAEVQSGRSIDLALFRAGLRKTTVHQVGKPDLEGACDEATHFVHTATVGAFAIASGSSGKASAAAEVFAYGGSASSESDHKAVNKDGSPDACKQSKAGSAEPVAQCQSPISLLLMPVSDAAAPASSKSEGVKAEAITTQCLPGFVFADGICTVEDSGPYVCDPSDTADCEKQCNAGNMQSCHNYAVSFGKSEKGIRQGMPSYKKACDGGVAESCTVLGSALEWELDPDKPNFGTMIGTVIDLYSKACDAGSGQGCYHAAIYVEDSDNPNKSFAKAFELYEAGCDLGDGDSCLNAADFMLEGRDGVSKNAKEGVKMLQRSCAAKYADACGSLGNVLYKGEGGVTKSPTAGAKLMVMACSLDTGWCATAGDMSKAQGKPDLAAKAWKIGCDKEDYECCRKLGTLYDAGEGVTKDPAKAKSLYQLACTKDEDQEACKLAGG